MGNIDDFDDNEYRKHSLEDGGEDSLLSMEDMTLSELVNFDNGQDYGESTIINYRYNIEEFEGIVLLFKDKFESVTKSMVVRTIIRWIYYKNKETIDNTGYSPAVFVNRTEGLGRSSCRIDYQLYDILDSVSENSDIQVSNIVTNYIYIFCDVLKDIKTMEEVTADFEFNLKQSEVYSEKIKNSRIQKVGKEVMDKFC